MTDFDSKTHLARHDGLLERIIHDTPIPAARIKEAMLYALFPAGKRLRPLLVYLTGHVIGADQTHLDMLAIAIELIHCYSLVHDDLPAMDDDDFRRNRPSCHRAFDDATAILVGDGMQALAVEILLTHLPQTLPMPTVVNITRTLVNACGPSGMVSGQSLDLTELSKGSLDEETLQNIHCLKTGKLIEACIDMVLYAHPIQESDANALKRFAKHFGLVFQMQDDYLDQYGTLGKHRASDAANQKMTYASLYSQEILLNLIHQHYQHAHEALEPFGEQAKALHEFLESLAGRT